MHRDAAAVRIAKAICCAGALFVLTACSSILSTTNPDPRPAPETGTWVGSIADVQFGAGRMELVLAPRGADQLLRGSWKATFSNGQIASGTVRGTGDRQPFTLTCASGGTATMTLTTASAHATGTHETVNCSSLTRGSVDLTKS